jgi:hypothetical protein
MTMSDEISQTKRELDPPSLCAIVGTHVMIEISDKSGVIDQLEFDLVPDAQANFAAGLMSERTPLAQALAGHAAADVIPYRPPSGAAQTIKILDIQPGRSDATAGGADRHEILGQVMDRIARRESRQTALTAELHYGSIDADGIEEE